MGSCELKSINDWADFWRYEIGVNVIPANTRKKKTHELWKEWQDKPTPDEIYDKWKTSEAFNNGIAIILGKVWHNPLKTGLYLTGVDLDNQKSIEEICNRVGKPVSLSQLAQWTLVEQHADDCSKAHVLFYSHKSSPKKSSDSNGQLSKIDNNEIPAIEVKGLGSHGILFVTPSVHQNGQPYQIIGTRDPVIADDFINHIDNICRKYSIPYLDGVADNGNGKAQPPIQDLFKSDFTIFEGHNRHEALMRVMESLIARNSSILTLEEIKPLTKQWNNQHCNPPLYDHEFEKQWICATDFIVKNTNNNNSINQKEKEKEEDEDVNTSSSDSHPSITQILIRLARENTALFFKDQYGVPYGKILVSEHSEILALVSTKFEYYLSKLYYDFTEGEIVRQESLNNAKRVLIAETIFEAPTRDLNLRVAWGERRSEEICYDLADPNWRCIQITNEGWQIVNSDFPVMFARFNQKPQVLPDKNYPSQIFDDFLDLMHIKDPGHRLLTKVWIISLFIPEFPHPIGITYGEKGGSKSTFCRFVKRLVDPDKVELLTTPQEKAEFVQQLHHNYLAVYDNIKKLPPWFSDEACKAITGVGSSKRRLYSDDEDIIYDYKRSLMISGINNSLTDPDALDRSILTQFDRILDEQRKEESEIETIFEEMRPKLFGYILDMLVKTLQIKPSIKLSNLPRMADFTTWGEAVARAIGYQPMEFVNAYYDNIGKQNVEAIESNPVALAVEKFVNSWFKEGQETCWQSPTSKVLEKLNKVALAHGIDTGSKFWPKAANSLTKRLRPILSNLREGLGIHVVISRNTSGKNKNTSTIRIWKDSPPSPPSPPGQNQAQNEDKIGGGSLDGGDISFTEQQVSPPETGEIHAQKLESGGSGDGGGFISTSEGKERLLNDSPLPAEYVAFDFEWLTYDSEEKSIYAAAFVDNLGNSNVLHISDFNGSELDLLDFVKKEMLKYSLSIGWNTTGIDSDLAILNERCVKSGFQSIVGFTNKALPFIEGQTHIDLYKVFRNEMVKTSIFNNKYRSLKLDEVSKSLLGKGKIANTTGENVYTKSIEEQKEYVLRDAQLLMGLSKINSRDVLSLMNVIGQLTGLSLDEVCHSTISTWWSKVFEEMGFAPPSNNYHCINTKHDYEGGMVIEPKKGFYHNLKVVDVVSLYPSIAILYNISFDTINCECCFNRQDAKVPTEVIDKEYWICNQKEGAFPKKLKEFKAERIRQKQLGNIIKQQGLKILINGGYGLFGHEGFKYFDLRVAELITAYGRHTLSRMQEIAKSNGFIIVGGDTDSLFLQPQQNSHISKFISECKEKLHVEVEHDKTLTKAIITKKKHYVGITENGNIIVRGMEGAKNDRPPWINDIFTQFVKDILVDDSDPVVNLRQSVKELEDGKIHTDKLKISVRISKDPGSYTANNPQKKIGLLLNAKEGDLIQYYKSDNSDGVSLNPNDISVRKYKSIMWNTVKDILEIAGYDIVAIEQRLILDGSNTINKIHRQQASEVRTM
jgi:DNA polymerase elongation subunit (family B)